MKKHIKIILAIVLSVVVLAAGGITTAVLLTNKDNTPTDNGVKITYMVDGVEYTSEATNANGNVNSLLSAPKKDGYTFLGWYSDNSYTETSEVSTDTVFTADTMLYALYVLDSIAAKCDIEQATGFDVDNLTLSITVPNAQEYFSLSEAIKVSSYAKWTVTSDISGNNEIPSATVSLAEGDNTYYINTVSGSGSNKRQYTIKIRRREIYTVTYILNNGEQNIIERVEEDNKAENKSVTKKGYSFVEWQNNETAWNFETAIKGNVVFNAVWNANGYTVTFNSNNGSVVENKNVVFDYEYNFAVSERKGYTFNGWKTEQGTMLTGSNGKGISNWTIAENITVYADWTVNKYAISYNNVNGASNGNPAKYTVEDNNITLVDAEKSGYTFKGWFADSGFGTQVTSINTNDAKNINLWAKWEIITYTATFKADSVNVGTVNFTVEDTTLNTPVVPSKTGYNGAWENYTISAQDLTINAVYTAIEYTITYANTKGATNSNVTKYTIESADITLSGISATGYTFDGWYDGTNKVETIATGSYGDKTLTAKWTAIEYTITYENTKGAANSNVTKYTIESADITLLNISAMGYTFDGWYDGTNKVETIATGSYGDKTLTAKWTAIEYTITYENTKGAANSNVTKYTIESADITLLNISATGYTFDGWYDGTNKVETIATGSYGDKTLTAKWTAIEYTLILDYDEALGGYATGTSNPTKFTIESDFDLTALQSKVIGATFVGWFTAKNDGEGDKITKINPGRSADLTLYAHWGLETYTINYHNVHGVTNTNATTYTVQSENITITELSRFGYTFGGWYSDAALQNPAATTIVKGSHGNLDYYAKWIPVQYSITYTLYGGTYQSGSNPESYTIEDTVALISPKLDGYEFDGWYTASEGGEKVETIEQGTTGNLSLYARWIHISTITFNSKGGSAVSSISKAAGKNVSEPTQPTRDYYTFGGWYSDETCVTRFVFDVMPEEDITVYAKWIPVEYTITYILNGGVNASENIIKYTVEDAFSFANPTKTGYTFVAWFTDAQFTSAVVTEIAKGSHGNITLYANYSVNQYMISFNSNGGTSVAAITQNYATNVSAPSSPAKNGYNFDGWYSDAALKNAYTFTTMPAENITLYAKWSLATYEIAYHLSGGTNNTQNPATYTIESNTIIFAEPTKRGYEFVGWYSDSEYKNAITKIENGSYYNIEVYAKWEIISYSITYIMPENAQNSNIATYTVESDIVNLADAILVGNTFNGWYSDSNYTSRITTIAGGGIGNKTLYAKFTPNTYTIWMDGREEANYTVSFDLNGAQGSIQSQNITPEKPLKFPEIPSRSGYVFAGWYLTSDCVGEIYDFSENVCNNVVLYAKWIKATNTVISIGEQLQVNINGNDLHNYTFVPLVSGNITITTTGSIDTIGWLYDSNGTLLKANDDDATDQNFLIVYNVTAGKAYTISFRGYNKTSTGITTLHLSGSANVIDGGKAVVAGGKITVMFGDSFILNVPSAKEGHIFRGWADINGKFYTDAEGHSIINWDKDEETVLFSVWEANGFNVTFVTNGGTNVEGVSLPFGARLNINDYITTRSGYSFLGWYLSTSDSEPYNATTMPDHNITLYAKWTSYALNAIKYDESMKAISSLRDATVEDFGATCFDTDGNIVEISIAINGTLDAGQTVTVRLTASANGKTRTATITDVKVYGAPTLEYNDQIDYFNLADGLSSEWFGASGTDTYGEVTTIELYVENDYAAGDVVTVTIASIDVVGNVKYGYVYNVRVYGNPEIQYDELAGLSTNYNGSKPAFGATATDSFNEDLIVNTFILNKMYVNHEYKFTSNNRYRQDVEALFFDAEENDVYTFYHDKRNSSTTSWNTYFVIYNVTDGIIIRNISNSGQWSSTSTFNVEANKTYCIQIIDDERQTWASASVTVSMTNSLGEEVHWYRLGTTMNSFSGRTVEYGDQVAYFSAEETSQYFISVTVSTRTVLTIYDYTSNTTAYSNTSFSSSIRNVRFNVIKGHTYQIAIRAYGGTTDTSGSYTVTVSNGISNIKLYKAVYPLEEKNAGQTAYSTSTYDYVYFMALKDEELTFYCRNQTGGGSTTPYASFVLYNLTTGKTIQTFSNVSSNSGERSITFSAKAGEIYRIRISANISYLAYTTYVTRSDGSYVVCYNDRLTFDSLIAGQSTMVTLIAIDSKGNRTQIDVEAKVFGLPTITNPKRTDFRVDEEITADSLGITALDSYGNELNVRVELQSGERIAGHILTYLVTTVDSVGNVATKSINVKLYGDITVEYGLQGATEKTSTADDLHIKAKDSFGDELNVQITIVKGNLIAGQSVTFRIFVTDVAGNVYDLEHEYRVYSADDIELTYNAWLTDKIKLTSSGEEFDAIATDTYGENCIITIEAGEGYELAGGKTISLYIVATDKAGNIKRSEIISGIKVYDTPTAFLTDESKGYFINENDDITFLFTVNDSFGEELYADITADGELVGGTYVNITVRAIDDAGNLFEELYQFRVLAKNAIDVDLYVDGNLYKSLSVADGTDYILEIPDAYRGTSYCYADKDGYSYTQTDGKSIRALTSYTKLYLCQAISNIEALQSIALDGKYSLVCDLNLQGMEWTPVGTNNARFTGVFNGSGFTISNFTITSGSNTGIGFFAYNSGIIMDLQITDFTINISTLDRTVGGLVAYNYGTIQDSYANIFRCACL